MTETDTDALLSVVEAVTKAKGELDLAQHGAKYYDRVLAAAEARVATKQAALNQALAELRQAGGMTE